MKSSILADSRLAGDGKLDPKRIIFSLYGTQNHVVP